MKNLYSLVLSVLLLFTVSGCASLSQWVDDVYDGDPRMTEVKQTVDRLKIQLQVLSGDIKTRLASKLEILRAEAEMLGDLKKAEFELKLAEIRTQLEMIRTTLQRVQ